MLQHLLEHFRRNQHHYQQRSIENRPFSTIQRARLHSSRLSHFLPASSYNFGSIHLRCLRFLSSFQGFLPSCLSHIFSMLRVQVQSSLSVGIVAQVSSLLFSLLILTLLTNFYIHLNLVLALALALPHTCGVLLWKASYSFFFQLFYFSVLGWWKGMVYPVVIKEWLIMRLPDVWNCSGFLLFRFHGHRLGNLLAFHIVNLSPADLALYLLLRIPILRNAYPILSTCSIDRRIIWSLLHWNSVFNLYMGKQSFYNRWG